MTNQKELTNLKEVIYSANKEIPISSVIPFYDAEKLNEKPTIGFIVGYIYPNIGFKHKFSILLQDILMPIVFSGRMKYVCALTLGKSGVFEACASADLDSYNSDDKKWHTQDWIVYDVSSILGLR